MSALSRAALLPALSLLALAACGKKDAAPADSAGAPAAAAAASSASGSSKADADLADVTNYRLSMDKIDKYIAAQRNIAAKMKSMTPAEREAVKARNENTGDANASLDDMARNIEREPVMNDAIRSAGLSAREFALITISMMQSAMASSVLKMRPKDNQDSLVREMKANADNIKFYREHEAEITSKTKALQAEMKAAGAANEE
jgi:cell fate (sporulation/competence/biofilm development) regulator YmcA (YheA/YmcA/DUF963 family)